MNKFDTIQLPDAVVEEGFDDYMANVNIHRTALNSLKSDFVGAFQTGDINHVKKSFETNLKDVDLHWPEYDKFQAYFDEIGQMPHMWKRGFSREDRRISLLQHSVFMNICSLLKFKQNSEILLSHDGLKWSPCIFKSHCPIENHFREQWYQGALTGRPPFFPGDRNSVTLVHISYNFPYDEKYKDRPELPATKSEWETLVERYLCCKL
ncbi:MAG TPA: hypothetical protein PKC79_02165 [Solidesulfovibrio magneticus]|nr:hypothetical protein [Solidesulfovibrio magneticus]